MIPNELKNLKQWVVSMPDSKVPFRADSYKFEKEGEAPRPTPASVGDASTWCTYLEAQSATSFGDLYFDNIGFVFNDNGIVGIDIDKGFDEDAFPSEIAVDILNHLKSYAEFSRSGRGMHIFVKGKLPFDGRNNRDGVEIYQKGRFFICTERLLLPQFSTLIENQEGIDYVLEKYFGEKKEEKKEYHAPMYKPEKKMVNGRFVTIYPEIPQGCRNQCLTSLAGQWKSQGIDPKDILAKLLKVNQSVCKPPLGDGEVETIAWSVSRYTK